MHKKRRFTSAPALTAAAIVAIGGTLFVEAQIRTVHTDAPFLQIVSDDGAEFELSDTSSLPEELKAAVYTYVTKGSGNDFNLSGLRQLPEYSKAEPEIKLSIRGYLGRVLFSKNRFEEALIVLNSLSDVERQALECTFAYAETLKGLGNSEAADEAYRAHISQNPSHQAGHINYAIFLAGQERHSEAIDVLKHAIEITSGSRKGKSYSLLGITHTKLKDYSAAERAFEQSIRFRPGHGPTWRRLASSRAQLPDFSQEAVISTFQKSDAVAPGNANTKRDFADFYFSVGRFDEALPLYRDASKIAPEKNDILIQRAQNLMASERPSAARRLVKKIKAQRLSATEKQQLKVLDVVLNGSQARTLRLLNRAELAAKSDTEKFSFLLAFLNVGDFENARALAAGYEDASIFAQPANYVVGRNLYRAGRYSEAVDVFAALVAKNQQSPAYWLYTARVRSELGSPETALDAVEKAYALYPESGRITIEYSAALSAVGQRARAAEALFAYLEQKPKDARALTALAEFYLAEQNYDRAEQLYKIVHELQSDNLRIAIDLADVQFQGGRPAASIETLNKIIGQEPADTKARLMRARAFEKLGNKQAAISEYETVLKLDLDNEIAKVELHRIGG